MTPFNTSSTSTSSPPPGEIIGEFKTKVLGPGWYDPGNDSGSWAFFKGNFLTNPNITSSNPDGVIDACNTFIKTDHGSPDRGMWDTMGAKMSDFVAAWPLEIAANRPNEFSVSFLECLIFSSAHAAHNADLWRHVANTTQTVHDDNLGKFTGIVSFRQLALAKGWYDPTEDTGSWAFFKKTFLLNPKVDENDIPGLFAAVTSFTTVDHGDPDRGMWDKMDSNLKEFLATWKDHTDSADVNEIIVSFLACFQYCERAAHNADLWDHVAQAAFEAQQPYMSLLGDIVLFRYSCLGPGWYDPTEDTGSWAFFKSTFLLNHDIRDSEPAAVLKACTTFADADHGAPDRGMWNTMGDKMRTFVGNWTTPVTADKLNQFKIEFLQCFVIPEHAAHNADLWRHVSSAAWRIASWIFDNDEIEVFKFLTLGPGWYDPTEDTGSWAFFKSTFLTNPAVAADNLPGIIDACNTFIKTDHGAPDSGMWNTMGDKMSALVNQWKSPIDPGRIDEFLLAFLECMVIPSAHAAHNADLWRHVSGMAHRSEQKSEFAKAVIPAPTAPKNSGALIDREAYDIGEWTGSQINIIAFTPIPGMLPQYYTSILGYEQFHAQHVVRLNNKGDFAYFAVTNSRQKSGFITIMKTNGAVLRKDDDVIYPVGEMAGKFVWQEVYDTADPHGNWNHPGKMAVLDGVLIVAAQNWTDYSPGTSEDSLLWYDVTDPDSPQFMAMWTKTQMGIGAGEVATVDLVKTMDGKYLVTAGGDGHYVTFQANSVSTTLADWIKVSDSTFSGQHGSCIRSAQALANDGASDFYFDASRSDEVFKFTKFDNRGDSGATTNYESSLPGASRDWDTASIDVSEKRVPIVYSVKSGKEWDSYRIYQARLF